MTRTVLRRKQAVRLDLRAFTRACWIASAAFVLGCSAGGLAFTTDVRGTAAPVSWIAYQDGDGPWQTVPVDGHRYRLPIRSGRFGLALVCEQEPRVRIIHATTRELPSLQVSFSGGMGTPEPVVITSAGGGPELAQSTYVLACRWGTSSAIYSISGTVAGVRPNHVVEAPYTDFRPADEYMQKVPTGTRDLVLLEVPKEFTYPQRGPPARIILVRDIVVDREKRIDVDFNRDGFAPLTRTVTLHGRLPGEAAWFFPAFFTPLGTDVPLVYGTRAGLIRSTQSFGPVPIAVTAEKHNVVRFGAIPPERRRRGDLHRIEVRVNDEDAGTTRCVVRDARAPEDLVVELPPPLALAAVAIATLRPYPRFRATWKPYSGAQVYRLNYARVGCCGDVGPYWEVLLTAGWLEGTSSYTLPDFSTLAGWMYDWKLELEPLPPGSPGHEAVHWKVEGVSSNAGPSAIIGPAALRPIADGSDVRCAGREGVEGWGVGP